MANSFLGPFLQLILLENPSPKLGTGVMAKILVFLTKATLSVKKSNYNQEILYGCLESY